MLRESAGLAGASTMHGYSFRMVVMRFRMILQGATIDCKRGLLWKKVVCL